MGNNSLTKLSVALPSGVHMLGMILDSIQLAQLDQYLIWVRPTYISKAPTTTPYPTMTPVSETPATTPTPRSVLVEVCELPSGWLSYVIQPGEKLERLAARAGISFLALVRENCLGSAQVQPGDVVYLPPLSLATPTPPTTYRCGPPSGWRLVRVQPGDTLYRLALRYGTTIQHANFLHGYTIAVGDQLSLPPRIVIPPTWTPTRRPSTTLTATPAPSPSATESPTAGPSATPTPSPSATIAATIMPTGTVKTTQTPTATPTEPITPTLTQTPTPRATPTPTATPTGEQSPTSTPTATPLPPSPTATNTSVPPTATSTQQPSPAFPTPTPTPEATPTSTEQQE